MKVTVKFTSGTQQGQLIRFSASSNSREDMNEPFHNIVDLFRCDVDKSQSTPAEEFANFLNYDQDWVSAVKPAIEYLGFDIAAIRAQLLQNRIAFNARGHNMVVYALGENGEVFTNNGSLTKDLIILTLAGITQHSKINELIASSSGPFKQYYLMLKKKYAIKNVGTSLDVITLPKITRLYPETCGRAFNNKVVKEIVPYETFPGNAKPQSHVICCPLLPCCCPFSLKGKNNFHPVMLWVQIKSDDNIHRRDGNTTSLNQILTYYLAAYKSKAVSEVGRINFFLEHHLVIKEGTSSGQNLKLTKSSAILAKKCLSELQNMRKNDEKHATLMKLASTGRF